MSVNLKPMYQMSVNYSGPFTDIYGFSGIQRLADNAFIPFASDNSDFRNFIANLSQSSNFLNQDTSQFIYWGNQDYNYFTGYVFYTDNNFINFGPMQYGPTIKSLVYYNNGQPTVLDNFDYSLLVNKIAGSLYGLPIILGDIVTIDNNGISVNYITRPKFVSTQNGSGNNGILIQNDQIIINVFFTTNIAQQGNIVAKFINNYNEIISANISYISGLNNYSSGPYYGTSQVIFSHVLQKDEIIHGGEWKILSLSSDNNNYLYNPDNNSKATILSLSPPSITTVITKTITGATGTIKLLTISGTAENGNTVTVYDGSNLILSVKADANTGAWTMTPPVPFEHTFIFTAKATNSSGFLSEKSTPITFHFDSIAPLDPILVQGTGADTKVLTITRIETGGVINIFNGLTDVTSKFTAGPNGTYIANAGAFNGSETISLTATVTDAAGNTSPCSMSVSAKIDTSAPASPSITTTSATINNTKPTIAGVSESGSLVTVYDGGSPIGTATADANTGAWTFTPSMPFSKNNHIISSTATDAAGNVSVSSSSINLMIDTINTKIISTFGPRFEFVSTNYHPRVGVAGWNSNQFFLTESPTGNYVKGNVNQMNVDIHLQNNVGDFVTFDNTFNLGTAWSALTGTNGKPFTFSANSDGSIKSGAFWFDKGSATGTSYSVKFESFNINLPTSTSMSYPYINNQSSVQTLLTGLNLNNYSWGNSSNNFGIFWETPVNTATNTKTENFAFFDTNGLAIGNGSTTLTVSSSVYPSFGGPDSDGNYILFTYSGTNGNLQLYNPTSLVTTNYGATGNFNIGFNSASITTDCWDYTNRNSNGSFANYEVALSGVRNNQGVIDFYQLDAKTLTVTKTQTVTLSGSLGASRIQDIRLSDNSTTVFAYQDGAFLHLTEIGSDGTLISDYTQTLAAGAIFDRIRGLSNGLFEIVYRQPGAAPNSMNYEFQLFDTRSGPLSVNNTSTTSPTNYAGTAFNDTISVSAANSMVMGSEGNDILTATSTSTNAILSYEYLNEGITANLSTGIVTANNAQGALVKTDAISGFKNIVGTLYNDSITGDSNSNMFWILGGNDTINGNGGTDYAEFYNDRSDYLIVQNGNSWTVTDRGTSPLSGTTTISNVRYLEFGWDGTTIDLTATPVNHAMSGAVTITGQAAVGQTLTASNNLSDADGTGAITYQWLRNGAIINGAATSTYQAVQADLGTVLSVKASYTDGWNVYNSATSNTVTVAASSTSVSGLSYFWNKSALGHALLNGVSVSVVGSGATAQSQLLLSNVTIDSSGNVTADVTANLSSAADSFDVYLSLGTNASNAVFTSALSSTNFSVISSPSIGGGLNISGYGNLSGSTTQLISSGQTKLGSISFNAGSLSQFQISVLAGTDFNNSYTGLQSNVTPYSYISSTAVTGSDGSYTMQIASGNYTFGASNSPSNIGNAVTSADALAALKIAVGLNPNPSLSPSPYQIMSADYNHDGKVSAADALAILKAAVQYTGSTAPSWQFVSETADLSPISRTNSTYTPSISAVAGNFIQNMVGMIAGDVNGSWTPPSGSSYLETTNPNYFTQLSQKLSVPTSQWGV